MHLQRNVLQYLENTAKLFPDKIAFADEKNSFTFSELLGFAEKAGTHIIKNVFHGRFAVVLVDRTAISVAGLMASLEAGLTYVPLDVKMPAERLGAIIKLVSPAVILYSAKDKKYLDNFSFSCPSLSLEDSASGAADYDLLSAAREKVLDIDPVYMIFTSGSTGEPKGIPVSHRSVIDFTEWMTENCTVTSDDVLGNQAPFYFDLSVKDLYQTLAVGCTCHILPKKVFMFPTLLLDALNDKKITTLIWATSAFRLAADSGVFDVKTPAYVKKVILGGEALQARHLNIWKKAVPECTFINLYGPTEVTVDCTMYKIDRDFSDGEAVPIGKACRNMEVILLDEDLSPVPDGESGEICVRGIGLALGYFADPDKTAASFIQNPQNPYYPDRLYRTGDIAKLDENGDLVFLCRRDGQIKHMGYRIELGEIETALMGIDGVENAVCFFDADSDYIVCCAQTKLDPASLAARTKEKLPKYMTPNVWKTELTLPLNPNGKVDRAMLKEKYFSEKN